MVLWKRKGCDLCVLQSTRTRLRDGIQSQISRAHGFRNKGQILLIAVLRALRAGTNRACNRFGTWRRGEGQNYACLGLVVFLSGKSDLRALTRTTCVLVFVVGFILTRFWGCVLLL